MSVSVLNKSAVNEAKGVYLHSCNPAALTNKDLLILILEPLMKDRPLSVAADDILQNGLSHLATLSEFELSTFFGLNEKQSFHLMAVFELVRRMGRTNLNDEVDIRCPQDVRDAVYDLRLLDKEHFVCLFLNTKQRVIGRETISVGTLNAALVHPREVFKAAIRQGAANVIFAHNHPSQDPTPSSEDIELTKRLVECGQLLGIEALDHVIIGGERWTSLRELGHV